MKTANEWIYQEVIPRIAISLLLLLIAGAIMTLSRETISAEWLSSLASGLTVLSLAGMWVSYFIEKRAAANLRRDIAAQFSIINSSLGARIYNIYYSDYSEEMPSVSNRESSAYRTRLISELERARGEVRILTIAAREFLHQGIGFAYDTMKSLVRDRPVKLLLLHPWSEQAISRALQEDFEHTTFEAYPESILYADVLRSCDTLVKWMGSAHSQKTETRLYKVFPSCFLVFVNDVVFVEQYHFGSGGRASGKVPLFEVGKGGGFYEQLEGHFEHVWRTANPYSLSVDLVKSLRNPDPDQQERFAECIRFTRPDLFAS